MGMNNKDVMPYEILITIMSIGFSFTKSIWLTHNFNKRRRKQWLRKK
jgi:hypothetical protein